MVSFYRCSIESILTYCMGVWYWSCTAAERDALQRVINTAQKIIRCSLPSLSELSNSHFLKKAHSILEDPSHPGHEHLICAITKDTHAITYTNNIRTLRK